MGYDARTSFEAVLRENVNVDQVREAIQPLLDELETTLRTEVDCMQSKMVAFADGILTVCVDESVSYDYDDRILRPVASAIGALAAEAFEVELEDQDTGDAEERYTTWVEGPPAAIPEFKARAARDMIAVEDLQLPPGTTGLTLDGLATCDTFTLATSAAGESQQDSVARVTVDLQGLDLPEAQRGRIVRLAALLAREIAPADAVMHARAADEASAFEDEDRSAAPRP